MNLDLWKLFYSYFLLASLTFRKSIFQNISNLNRSESESDLDFKKANFNFGSSFNKFGRPTFQMLHSKSQGYQLSGSEENYFKGFYEIYTCRLSWSCDQSNLS